MLRDDSAGVEPVIGDEFDKRVARALKTNWCSSMTGKAATSPPSIPIRSRHLAFDRGIWRKPDIGAFFRNCGISLPK